MSSKYLSEFDLIEWIRQKPQSFPDSILKSIGDDCAVFDPQSIARIAVTTDSLLESVHFQRHWISASWLGRKSLVVNLSDLAAMGAKPYACLLNLELPNDLDSCYPRAFMKGFLQETAYWKIPLLGGNLSSNKKVHAGITAWGSFQKNQHPIYRSGGQEHDILILIGDVGFSRLGLEILKKENSNQLCEITDEDSLKKWSGDAFRFRCLKAHLLPFPLIAVGMWLCEKKLANSMIDISDGLASDLLHLANESQLEAEIKIDRLYLPEHAVDKVSPLEAALNGGEDYALLLSASEKQLHQLTATYPSDFPPYQIMGKLSSGKPAVYLTQKEERRAYEPKGFDHFG